MKSKVALSAIFLAAGVAAAGGLVYAEESERGENDRMVDLAKATIGLAQAVSTAEATAAGKAIKAELDAERGEVAYDVEVVTADHKVVDVRVDAASGAVLSSRADEADREGSERGEREDGERGDSKDKQR